MSKKYICIAENGCRLTDLGLKLDHKQIFERSDEVINGSRSIVAAINAGWIKEFVESNEKDGGEVKRGRGRPKKIPIEEVTSERYVKPLSEENAQNKQKIGADGNVRQIPAKNNETSTAIL